ncbi:MAG: hypothetical protein CMA39_04010 [Euryarchaeota archaeon]|jgi:K+/H+ antiporter YhaU regulatory subunit KhtT|nr:hypothetical protein [Euryarchaeota archaeon]MCH2647297.1 hypothetical protein [Candidatus Poseidoniaceae archaeon]DAC39698.1 MAG TPA: hypothetical protein D7H83_03975 [Candidatus Poseidoniales archaeon]HIH57526.1 hypothetical protein [Candidatus Poseidoniaceae archaeon]|tara:strand:+ start:2692 stop:3030 length:339 start_codon:yes stop_codon:yes gene_type:complete
MGWWPFKKKPATRPIPDVIRRDTRSWLSDLQEVCERNFDSPEEARRQIRQMAGEWSDANREGVMEDSLLEGLNMRAYRLLNCSDDEFSKWLDDLNFWKPGWRPEGTRETDES